MSILDEIAWMDDALCSQIGGDIFYPERVDNSKEAQSVCAMCPVRQQCLDYATRHDISWGVWGGIPQQRREQYYIPNSEMVEVMREVAHK